MRDKNRLRDANVLVFVSFIKVINFLSTGVEIQCIGQFGLIFGMVSARARPALQLAALRCVLAAAGCRECVEDVAASAVLGHLLLLLADRPPRQEALAALAALLANTALVKEALAKGTADMVGHLPPRQ